MYPEGEYKPSEYTPWAYGGEPAAPESLPEKITGGARDLVARIRTLGILKTAVIVVVVVVTIWFLFFRATPASIKVTLLEIDTSSPVVGMPVMIAGRTVYTDTSGITPEVGADAGSTVTVQPLPDPATHFRAPSPLPTFVLQPGPNSYTMQIPRDWDFAVTPVELNVSLGQGCTAINELSVRNTGLLPATVAFVAEGDISPLALPPASAKPVGAGGTTTVTMSFRVPENMTVSVGDSFSGSLRIRQTQLSVPVTVTMAEGGAIAASPDAASVTATTGSVASATVSISNVGYARLSVLSVSDSGDINYWTTETIQTGALLQGESRPLQISINVPPGVAPGTYTGLIQVQSDCNALDIPLTVDVRIP